MIINHPLLGPRDSEEFVYLGSADLINRPTNWESEEAAEEASADGNDVVDADFEVVDEEEN